MVALGMLCLGCFVGAIVNVGLSRIDSLKGFLSALAPILAAVVGGAVIVFAKELVPGQPERMAPYPVGLLLAILWYYASHAIDHIKDDNGYVRVLGFAHVLALVLITLLAVALFVAPAILDMLRGAPLR